MKCKCTREVAEESSLSSCHRTTRNWTAMALPGKAELFKRDGSRKSVLHHLFPYLPPSNSSEYQADTTAKLVDAKSLDVLGTQNKMSHNRKNITNSNCICRNTVYIWSVFQIYNFFYQKTYWTSRRNLYPTCLLLPFQLWDNNHIASFLPPTLVLRSFNLLIF